jgi:hypothetical protein
MLGSTVSEVIRTVPTDVAVLIDRGLTRVDRVLAPLAHKRPHPAVLALARRLRGADKDVTLLQLKPTDSSSFVDMVLAESSRGYDLVLVDATSSGPAIERLMRAAATSVLLVHGAGVPVAGLAHIDSRAAVPV